MARGKALDAIQALADWCPEHALVAAMIRLAMEDSLDGDPDARSWLAGDGCAGWLWLVVPRGVDGEAVHDALVQVVEDDFRHARAAWNRRRARARRLARERRLAASSRPSTTRAEP